MDEIEAILVDTPRRKSAEIALYFLSCTLAAHRVLSSYERRDSITVYRPCAVASCSVISTKGRNPCFEQGEKSFLDPAHSFGMTMRFPADTVSRGAEKGEAS